MKPQIEILTLLTLLATGLIVVPLKWTAPLLVTRMFVQIPGIRQEQADQLRIKTWNDLYLVGRYEEAVQANQKAVEIYQSIGDRLGEAMTWNNMGLARFDQGLYPQALDFFQKSLTIRQEIGDKEGIIKVLYNIGTLYEAQGQYPQSLEYYQQALAQAREVNDFKWQNSILRQINQVSQRF